MRRGLEVVSQDLGYAVRSFRRNPGFVAVALLSLTLGIGATSAIFSVIYGVLIAPYPYARPEEIWAPEIRAGAGRGGRGGHTPDEFAQMSKLPAFSDMMATSIESVLLTGETSPESFAGVMLSGNAFNFLGVPPIAGRTIQPTDIRPDGEPEAVTVLSYRLWLRLFQGDPGAIGKTLLLNDRRHTVIGVMPPRFGWYGNDSLWLPLGLRRRENQYVAAIVRLAPGVSKRAAEEQLQAFHLQQAREHPENFPAQGFTTVLRNYMDITVASGEMRTSLRLLLGAVGFLLLIACANVANLQLARGTARAREMAVRVSIGAGRSRLFGQLLTESVLLSLVGGIAGVLFALASTKMIVALMPEFYVPNEARVTINTPVLLFSLVVSVLTGIVFGMVPALKSSRPDVIDALKVARGAGETAHGGRIRNLLVVVEVALSVVLLVSAGLTVRTFLVLQHVDLGLHAERVLIVGVPLSPVKYPTLDQRNHFAAELLELAASLPGVEAATVGNGGTPFGGPSSPFSIVGDPSTEQRRVALNLVGADYLRTFGIPLRTGRMFTGSEVLRGDRVAVINESAARLWPPGSDPMSGRVRLGLLDRPPSGVFVRPGSTEVTIIGVVANTRNAGIRSEPSPAIFLPYTFVAPPQRTLALRAAGDPALLLGPLRQQLRGIDSQQPLGRPFTLDEVVAQQVIQPRFTMALFSAFAAIGLALAAAGIYSVLSFHVVRRTQELGVRMALGAPRSHVLGLMLLMGGRLVATGLIAGVLISLGVMRLLRSQLFGVSPNDPLAYVAVALLLSAVAFLACYLPARRAAAVEPLVALRQE
jgi:putative ABC transport system permease protein